jgi:sodium/bile acid cotransporter 7
MQSTMMADANDAEVSDKDASLSIGLTVHHSEPSKQKQQVVSNNNNDNDPESGASLENNTQDQDVSPPPSPLHKRLLHKWQRFYHQNSFLILIICAILLAYAYPPLGAIYVAPDITATWIAVIFIFILAGMGIRTEEFSKAFKRIYFNAFVQIFNFMVVSGIVYGFTRFMLQVKALPESLADGMTICASLPITVNMVLILTKMASGDEAAAIFNAAFSNFVGIFLSPALILMYVGLSAEVDISEVTLKLFFRVILPILLGQILRNFVPPATEFVKKYSKHFKLVQELCLVFIVYTVFCDTFLNGSDVKVGDVFIMIGCVFLMLILLMVLAWTSVRVLFPKEPKLQAVGLFACTHKTVAMGVPLINSIYADNPMAGLYILPLLVWHTMQLVLGTALGPYVAKYVHRREKELQQQQEQPVLECHTDEDDEPQPDLIMESTESGR